MGDDREQSGGKGEWMRTSEGDSQLVPMSFCRGALDERGMARPQEIGYTLLWSGTMTRAQR